jgi:hypothetical protein
LRRHKAAAGRRTLSTGRNTSITTAGLNARPIAVHTNSNVTSRLIAEHYETHEYNNFYPVSGDVTNNLNPTDGKDPTVRKGWQYKLQNLFNYTPNYNVPNNASLDTQQRLVSRITGLSNELNVNLGFADLTAVTAWRQLYFRPYNDGDYCRSASIAAAMTSTSTSIRRKFASRPRPAERSTGQSGPITCTKTCAAICAISSIRTRPCSLPGRALCRLPRSAVLNTTATAISRSTASPGSDRRPGTSPRASR